MPPSSWCYTVLASAVTAFRLHIFHLCGHLHARTSLSCLQATAACPHLWHLEQHKWCGIYALTGKLIQPIIHTDSYYNIDNSLSTCLLNLKFKLIQISHQPIFMTHHFTVSRHMTWRLLFTWTLCARKKQTSSRTKKREDSKHDKGEILSPGECTRHN